MWHPVAVLLGALGGLVFGVLTPKLLAALGVSGMAGFENAIFGGLAGGIGGAIAGALGLDLNRQAGMGAAGAMTGMIIGLVTGGIGGAYHGVILDTILGLF